MSDTDTSTKSTPTQGPWKHSFESADPNWAIVTDALGGIVANVNGETGPDAISAPAMRKMPSEANARLIAAAPELYEALKHAVAIIRAHVPVEALGINGNGMEGPYDQSWPILDEMLHYMDAALAKARGEQP